MCVCIYIYIYIYIALCALFTNGFKPSGTRFGPFKSNGQRLHSFLGDSRLRLSMQYMNIHVCVCVSLSLSLYIYISIHNYISKYFE